MKEVTALPIVTTSCYESLERIRRAYNFGLLVFIPYEVGLQQIKEDVQTRISSQMEYSA